MAAGDVYIDGSALGCGCSKFRTLSIAKAWPGTMFVISNARFIGDTATRILYFKNFQEIVFDITNQTGIYNPPNPRDAYSFVTTTSYSLDSATFGVATVTVSNPDNLYKPNEFYPSYPLIASDLSLGVGSYTFELSDTGPTRTAFTAGSKYSFRIKFQRADRITVNNPAFANSGYRLFVQVEWLFTEQITEAEFDEKLRLVPMVQRIDLMGFTQRKIALNQWAGGGHACRLLVDRLDPDISFSTAMLGTDLMRGFGIMRSAVVYPPGQHSLRTHVNSTPATSANSLPLFTTPPGVAVSQDGGSYWSTRSYASGGNIPAYGTQTDCANIELDCNEQYTIPIPATNLSIEFREDEVCPP